MSMELLYNFEANCASRVWPSDPSQLLPPAASDNPTGYTGFRHTLTDLHTGALIHQAAGSTVDELLSAVAQTVGVAASELSKGGCTLFAVHPKAVLLPLYKWYCLRDTSLDGTQIRNDIQALQRNTVDLCELFYYPSILTYQCRSSFGPDILCSWLGLDCCEEEKILRFLWSRN